MYFAKMVENRSQYAYFWLSVTISLSFWGLKLNRTVLAGSGFLFSIAYFWAVIVVLSYEDSRLLRNLRMDSLLYYVNRLTSLFFAYSLLVLLFCSSSFYIRRSLLARFLAFSILRATLSFIFSSRISSSNLA